MILPTHFFIFDVEAIGIHGDAYAVAGGIWHRGQLSALREFCYGTDRNECGGRERDREWVDQHCPHVEITHTEAVHMRMDFWKQWKQAQQEFPGIVMMVECGWPVEARFLAQCVDDMTASRGKHGPYPLHEIATVMALAGIDPMTTWPRTDRELPSHHPTCDTRQSARLLMHALDKLQTLWENELKTA